MTDGFDSFEAWRADEAPGGAAERRALKQRAIALLARREHSRAELRRKLLVSPVRGGRGRRGMIDDDEHLSGHEPEDFGLDHCDQAAGSVDPEQDAAARFDEVAARPSVRRAGLGRAVAPRPLPSPAVVDSVLDELAELRLLSDRRMAEALVRSGSARFGAARLSQNLQRKGVAEGLISEVLQPLADNETERAREVWQRRFGGAPVDMKDRARQYRFLLGRGFASAVVSRVVPPVAGRASGDEDWADMD
ncbi:MAG: regulatory protein RecX [Lautropia sp.]|nr:regulatory protein RecX [Lautropia sp.]